MIIGHTIVIQETSFQVIQAPVASAVKTAMGYFPPTNPVYATSEMQAVIHKVKLELA